MKTLTLLLITIFLLAACTPETTVPTSTTIPESSSISAPTAKPTNTPVSTATIPSTVTKTPTEVVSGPHDLEYYLEETNWEIAANEEELINKAAEIVNQPSFLSPDATFSGMGPIAYKTIENVDFYNSYYGENCIVRDGVLIPIAGSNEYHHYLIWEILGPDNKPQIFTTYVGTVNLKTEWEVAQIFIKNIQSIQPLTISLTIRFIRRDYPNPYLYTITDALDPALINALKNGTIPDDIWKTIFFAQFN